MTGKQKNIFKFDCTSTDVNESFDYLTIPDSLITYTRDLVFSTWQTLETQLSQVDPAEEPEMYQALDARTSMLCSAWLQFREERQ